MRKNLQHRLIFFNLDNMGAVVVRYIYDAWGNHAIVDANGEGGIFRPFKLTLFKKVAGTVLTAKCNYVTIFTV